MSNNKGFFMTFEGGEGVGKTTQIQILRDSLVAQGHDVVITREPGGTAAGEAMRDVFVTHRGQNWSPEAQALFIFAARRLHTDEVIKPALSAGKIVISDRYTDSTRGYQGVASPMGIAAVERLKQEALGDFEPDLTFIMDMEVMTGLARTDARGQSDDTFEDKDTAFHETLRQAYLTIAKDHPERCVVIDASQSVQDIAGEIFSITESLLSS